jgi:hypothetical protein
MGYLAALAGVIVLVAANSASAAWQTTDFATPCVPAAVPTLGGGSVHSSTAVEETTALVNRMAVDADALSHVGVPMSMWEPDPATGKVIVFLRDGQCQRSTLLPTSVARHAQRVLDARYGPGKVIVSPTGMPPTIAD